MGQSDASSVHEPLVRVHRVKRAATATIYMVYDFAQEGSCCCNQCCSVQTTTVSLIVIPE